MISLSDIIKESVLFVSKQLEEAADKYYIEEHLKSNSPRYENDCMPEIIKKWGVEEEDIILIEYIGHDLNCRAFKFENIEDLEERLLGPSSYLNDFVCYVIPVIKGQVKTFEVSYKKIKWS